MKYVTATQEVKREKRVIAIDDIQYKRIHFVILISYYLQKIKLNIFNLNINKIQLIRLFSIFVKLEIKLG